MKLSVRSVFESWRTLQDWRAAVIMLMLALGGAPGSVAARSPQNDAPPVAEQQSSKQPAVSSTAPARPEPPVPLQPGQVVEMRQPSRAVGVTTLTLSNGVILHVRIMKPAAKPEDQADAGEVRVVRGDGGWGGGRQSPIVMSICVAGGEIQESAENRGITSVAFNAWDRLSVRSMRRDDLSAFLEDEKCRINSRVTSDAVMLRIEGDVNAVEAGLRVARLLLTEPVVSDADVESWKGKVLARRENAGGAGGAGGGAQAAGRRAVFDAVVDLMFDKADARPRRISNDALTRLRADEAQRWIDHMLGVAPGSKAHPIEAAIVGDVTIEQAVRLGTLYLATLPPRVPPTPATFANERRAARNKAPMIDVRTSESVKGHAYIVSGFLGADLADVRDYRTLAVAAEIIEQRLSKWPADERGDDGAPDEPGRRGGAGGGGGGSGGAGVQAIPGSAYPGFGLVLGVSEVPPHRASELLDKLSAIFESVRERGPGDDEVREVSDRLANSSREFLQRPGYWSTMLASSVYHGLRLEDMLAAESSYAAITPADVKAVLAKYDTPDRRVRVRIMPSEKP